MPYTLWLRGRLIGETDFDHAGPGPSQRVGILRPTDHGSDVLPELTGMLSATLSLKRAMERRGLRTASDNAPGILQALGGTREGQRVIELSRALAQVELRDPAGHSVSVQSIAVTDARELAGLARSLHLGTSDDLEAAAIVAPRFLVSATMAMYAGTGTAPRRTQPRLRPRWRR
ncbi:MAG: hypothetical protein WD801_09145 [Gemmatimonadaceae bacterium]